MRFDPGAATAHLIPDGTWCHALIVNATEQISKKNNAMIVATFKVWAADKQAEITHYFVDKQPGMLKKLCTVMGMSGAFEAGELFAEDLVNRELEVMVKIREDESGQFGDKNVLAAFRSMPPKGAASTPGTTAPAATPVEAFDPNKDDGVPF